MSKPFIVTIDGPAASGKTTAARGLARRLGLAHLDSGALYRALTLVALEEKVDLSDEGAVVKLLEKRPPRLVYTKQGTPVLVGERDVTDAIRAPRVTADVRHVAESRAIREALLPIQRRLAEQGIVAEGRDMGTVVFPDARCKFYLDASLAERARRRHLEHVARGESVSPLQVQEEIEERDRRDSSRSLAPLKQADDAIYIDSSDLRIEEVVDKLYKLCQDTVGRID